MRGLDAADLFCGAGIESDGFYKACEDLGLPIRSMVAVNHWKRACETYKANHPQARVLCEPIEKVDPRVEVPRLRLDILIASPECVFHSRALGGKPVNDQRRSSGWAIPRWLDLLDVDALLIENVPEYVEWGPTRRMRKRGVIGQFPDPDRKGETFQALLAAIRSYGFSVEYRKLCAADYGDATTRERLFILGRRNNGRIVWPEPTHAAAGDGLFARRKWRSASEIIDWSIPTRSIYGRKKPLSAKTLERIAYGLVKCGGGQFVLAQGGGGVARPATKPVPTIATGGAVRLVEPFIVTLRNHTAPRSVDQPITNVTASGNHHVLVEAFIASYYGTKNIRSIRQPLPTVTTKDRFALVEPVVVDGQMLDIRTRMLDARELARATSIDDDYVLIGNKTEQKQQIGNAVPRELARALCRAQLSHLVGDAQRVA